MSGVSSHGNLVIKRSEFWSFHVVLQWAEKKYDKILNARAELKLYLSAFALLFPSSLLKDSSDMSTTTFSLH